MGLSKAARDQQTAIREEIRERLREDIRPGTDLHVLRSSDNVRVLTVFVLQKGTSDMGFKPIFCDVTRSVAVLLGLRTTKRGWIAIGGAQFNPCDKVSDLVSGALGYINSEKLKLVEHG